MKRAWRIGQVFFAMVFLCPALRATMNMEDLGQGRYHLEGRFNLNGSRSDVWGVLTDYKHMPAFIPSLRKSAVKESATGHVVLEQEALVKEFIFSRHVHVLLQVSGMPYEQIDFEDVLHKDFYFYKGSWSIEDHKPGLDVIYRLDCKRRFSVPNFIAKDALRKSAETLLAAVRTEILKRQQRVSP